MESFFLEVSPEILALCETNMNSLISSIEFSVPCYLPLFRKGFNIHMHALGVCVREHLPQARELSFESPDCSYMFLYLSLLNSLIYLFFYLSPPSHKQYSFCFSRSTTDMLMTMSGVNYQALDRNDDAQTT